MVQGTRVVHEPTVCLETVLDGLSEVGDHRFEVHVGVGEGDGWQSAEEFADPARCALLDDVSQYLSWRGASGERGNVATSCATAFALVYRRRTCCLIRLVPGNDPCDTCSLPAARAIAATS